MLRAIFMTFICTMCLVAFAQNPSQKSFKFFKGEKTYIQNPFELRDPFKKPKKIRTAKKVSKTGKMLINNSFSNIKSIESVPISQIRIVGILLGTDRRAVAKVATGSSKDGAETLSKGSYILKEGMVLGGDEEAEVKAILPGGVVLVEKIRNVYDQDEYLETIIPVYGTF